MTNAGSSYRWLLLLALLPSLAVAAEQTGDQRFLAGLRGRGLYRLAEAYCTDRMKRPELPAAERAELTIELSRSLAEQAVNSPPERRPPLWQKARRITDDFALRYPQDPRLPLVRLQGVLGLLARGELARQEAELAAGSLAEGRDNLRAAAGGLVGLLEVVERQLRRQNLAARGNPALLAARRLAALQKSIQYELARAYRNQAECYPAESPDRADALGRAVGLLGPLSRLDAIEPLAWKSRIDLVICYRLLGERETAERILDGLLKQEPPPRVQLRLRAEGIRLALAGGRTGEAVALLGQRRQIGGLTSPELDFARLEACLAASRAAIKGGRQDEAEKWQARAAAVAEQIERLYCPYWTLRAGALLSRHLHALPGTGNLSAIVLAAERSYRSGRLDDALALYDDARKLAARQGDAAKAFDLGYTAAAIEDRCGRHAEALRRFREIAAAAPGDPDAPAAHLMAIYHAGQIAKKQPQGSLDGYLALLDEHLRIWPSAPGAGEVRLRLGRLYEHRRQWRDAIAAYRAVLPEDEAYTKAIEAAGRCCRSWLGELKAAGKPFEQIAADAAEWFESLLVDRQGRLPESWSPIHRFAALQAARLRLSYTPTGYTRAQQVLSAALEGAADAPQEWKSAARSLLVFSLAGGGRHGEAADVLAQISAGQPDQLLDMLEGLAGAAANARPGVRTQLAALQLRTIELLRAGGTTLRPSQQQKLERLYAKALADSERNDEALAAYRSLAARYPRDGEILEQYVRLLLTRQDRDSLRAALAESRRLEKHSPPQSTRWFRAKYCLALAHHRLGNDQQAAKIITLLKLLHPELGGPEMKAKFEHFLQRCQGNQSAKEYQIQ